MQDRPGCLNFSDRLLVMTGNETAPPFWDLPPPPPHTKIATCTGTASASVAHVTGARGATGTYSGTDCALAYAAAASTKKSA